MDKNYKKQDNSTHIALQDSSSIDRKPFTVCYYTMQIPYPALHERLVYLYGFSNTSRNVMLSQPTPAAEAVSVARQWCSSCWVMVAVSSPCARRSDTKSHYTKHSTIVPV